MTPKRIQETLFFARKRINYQRLEEFEVARMAASSDEKAVKAFVKRMMQ